MMRFASFLILIVSTISLGAASESVPIVFDTDITGDVDDVLALAMIHSLADRGRAELRAVTISKKNELAAPFVDAVNTFYGRPNIPIGISGSAPERESRFLKLAEERLSDGSLRYPRTIGVDEKPSSAVSLLREVLANGEDRSIVLVQVGLAVNTVELLESGPDEISDLSGLDLVKRKVKLLSVMAGAFQTIKDNNRYLEANVRNHIPSMQSLAEKWPEEVAAIWSGFAVGIAVTFPRESVAEDFDYLPDHPVKEAYLLHSGPNHDRPSWDLTSVLYAVYPERDYFTLSAAGRVSVEEDGFTRFAPKEGGRDRFLKVDLAQAARVREALVHLVVQPPLSPLKPWSDY
ncbi:MAG: nucleoside hydrolase [Verrucomicrobiota bacterium]